MTTNNIHTTISVLEERLKEIQIEIDKEKVEEPVEEVPIDAHDG